MYILHDCPYENYMIVTREVFIRFMEYSGFSIAPAHYYKNRIIDGEEYMIVGALDKQKLIDGDGVFRSELVIPIAIYVKVEKEETK